MSWKTDVPIGSVAVPESSPAEPLSLSIPCLQMLLVETKTTALTPNTRGHRKEHNPQTQPTPLLLENCAKCSLLHWRPGLTCWRPGRKQDSALQRGAQRRHQPPIGRGHDEQETTRGGRTASRQKRCEERRKEDRRGEERREKTEEENRREERRKSAEQRERSLTPHPSPRQHSLSSTL